MFKHTHTPKIGWNIQDRCFDFNWNKPTVMWYRRLTNGYACDSNRIHSRCYTFSNYYNLISHWMTIVIAAFFLHLFYFCSALGACYSVSIIHIVNFLFNFCMDSTISGTTPSRINEEEKNIKISSKLLTFLMNMITVRRVLITCGRWAAGLNNGKSSEFLFLQDQLFLRWQNIYAVSWKKYDKNWLRTITLSFSHRLE